MNATLEFPWVLNAPLVITTTTLPPFYVGVPYGPVQLTATGGSGPDTWSVPDAANFPLPAGVTLSAAGVLSGTPSGTVGQTGNSKVEVADQAG